MEKNISIYAKLKGMGVNEKSLVARNHGTEPSVLAILLNDSDGLVRFEAGRNSNLNAREMEKVLKNFDFYQLCGFAANQRAPESILSWIIEATINNDQHLSRKQIYTLQAHLLGNRKTTLEMLTPMAKNIVAKITEKYGRVGEATLNNEEAAALRALQIALDGIIKQNISLKNSMEATRSAEINTLEEIWRRS